MKIKNKAEAGIKLLFFKDWYRAAGLAIHNAFGNRAQ